MTMTTETQHRPDIQQGEIILCQPDETVRLKVRLEDDTVWLTQAQMAELFSARLFVENLIKAAKCEVVLIDKNIILSQL